jgi:SAM-dependent methyltransferase
MAFEFHTDKPRYFQYQYLTAKEYIIPFVSPFYDWDKEWRVLEIGCGEAGVLKAFLEKGCLATGIELYESRVDNAKKFLHEDVESGRLDFITRNVYDIDVQKDIGHGFDLIILKDVIEHIHDQERFIPKLKEFLNPNGKVFFGFPPWYMPFGGHQQNLKGKLLSKVPYFHLLPTPAYRGILKTFGESQQKVDNMLEIKETGISIERFERIVKKSGFKIESRKLWLLNPIYKYKFGLKPTGQLPLVGHLPFARNFYTTAAYYLIGL